MLNNSGQCTHTQHNMQLVRVATHNVTMYSRSVIMPTLASRGRKVKFGNNRWAAMLQRFHSYRVSHVYVSTIPHVAKDINFVPYAFIEGAFKLCLFSL